MTELTLHEKLIDIQQRLKVPKDKKNEYATSQFMYRNLEAIEEAIKPLLKEHKLVFTFSDEIVAIGDRIYVRASAQLSDGKDSIQVSAFAQHALNKRGMDDAQLTGSCSSYARKYAAGGLFLIDETKDVDSMDNSPRTEEKKEAETDILTRAKKAINKALVNAGYETALAKIAFITSILDRAVIENLNDCDYVMNALEKENGGRKL